MPEEAAEKKVVTWLFLSVGEPARKLFKDKYPELSVWTLQTREMLQRCENCFYIARNRTLDRHKFLSRKQQANESLQQFWHMLNGLASKCELGEITQTLVHDVFINISALAGILLKSGNVYFFSEQFFGRSG